MRCTAASGMMLRSTAWLAVTGERGMRRPSSSTRVRLAPMPCRLIVDWPIQALPERSRAEPTLLTRVVPEHVGHGLPAAQLDVLAGNYDDRAGLRHVDPPDA